MSIPKNDGYHMPGEFERHRGCIMIWPERPGSWPSGAVEARRAFKAVIEAIAQSEEVFVAVSPRVVESAERMLSGLENVRIFQLDSDDAWARDVGPTFVKGKDGSIRAVNWEFNAWGGEYNGLYAHWEKDNAFAKAFADMEGYAVYDAAPFVLEGGSIHSDGEGTIMVTESCLLSKGRNPELTKEEIEERLKNYLGAEKILWLPCGIYNDETDEHVDNVCAFVKPGEVVLAWTDNEADPQYAMSKADLDYLENVTDAKGRKLIIHRLPIPDKPVCVQAKDLEGYEFEEGEDTREEGERLAASYVNFYISNGAVVMPAFGSENAESDKRAADILQKLYPERKVICIDARAILLGGGNIHCITQQILE